MVGNNLPNVLGFQWTPSDQEFVFHIPDAERVSFPPSTQLQG